MDYLGKPFGQMPNLLAIADYITKLHAICVKCGNIASFSHRIAAKSGQVLLGEKDIYEPLCRKHYFEAMGTQHF
jgi:thymidine kinase